jgi:hypothetical protein
LLYEGQEYKKCWSKAFQKHTGTPAKTMPLSQDNE